ncbi:cytochrome P450 [Hyaloscypha variabilis F]|uniref:Cytochrome P450 n=1 Tax=Hyaloscypha variabilis (strain UAMH 11265 / GT02V1 / F) TaxID=1149755 RepID=A0A2J6RZF1_HYAVF|nr:cytochrome P450 [Hyaloscypha variabilis F]
MSKNVFTHLEKFLLKLEEFDRQSLPLDTYRWFRYLTFEVVTDIGFGADYDMISHGELNHPFKSFLGPQIERIPLSWMPKSLREWRLAEVRTEEHARGGLQKWLEQKNQGIAGHRVDILQRLIEHGEKNPEDKLTEKELVTEIMEIMLAGGDTTASTVTYACYEITRFPEVQDKLRKALKDAIPDASAPITLEMLEAIPYLDWTVKEMLRMHPTIPSSLERVVPPKGADVAGYHLEGGTIVCMQAFTQHRQEEIFPKPEEFQPERWEHADAKMRANLLAFSSGARSCVGQNLATMQMKIHMGMILRKYRIKGHPDTTPYSMEPLDFFQGKPRAGKCLLYFEKDE